MKSILLIEPLSDGHRAVYAGRLAAGLADKGWQVHIATTVSSAKHLAFKNCLSAGPRIKIHVFPDEWFGDLVKRQSILGLVKREFTFRRLFGEIYRSLAASHRIDLVFVPYLDYCLHAFSLLGSPFGGTSWAGIVMRPAFHYAAMGIVAPAPRMAWVKKQIFLRLLRQRTLKNLFSIDESLCHYMASFHAEQCTRLVYLADPADHIEQINKEAAKKALGIPEKACLILVFGAIGLRKGISNLLAATMQKEFPQNVHILLAGKQSEEIKSWLNDSHVAQKLFLENRLHAINDFLDESQQSMVFSASDIVWLGYKNHYTMSGVLVQAGRMGIPVLSGECGLISWYVDRYKIGRVADLQNPYEVAAAIVQLAGDGAFTTQCGENGKRSFSHHSTEQFISVVDKHCSISLDK